MSGSLPTSNVRTRRYGCLMTSKHVFLSYLREDAPHVDELQKVLEAAEFTVWRDTANLWPGDNLKRKIREAIQGIAGCSTSTPGGEPR